MTDKSYIAASAVMRGILDELALVAKSDLPIILLGETGVGKSFVAKEIHRMCYGGARDKHLVEVSSGELGNGLADSILFGHVKGAFTGAHMSREGFIAAANGSTLFIDEIGDLPPSSQTKLLTVLDSGKYHNVGDTETKVSNPRLIVATNKDLEHLESFRSDLYQRLAGYVVTIPPLRERPEDITAIAHHYLGVYSEKYGRAAVFDDSALAALQAYPWPGNIRELDMTVKRTLLMAPASKTILTASGLRLVAHGTSAAHVSSGLDQVRNTHTQRAAPREPEEIRQLIYNSGRMLMTLLTELTGEGYNIAKFTEASGDLSRGTVHNALGPTQLQDCALKAKGLVAIPRTLDRLMDIHAATPGARKSIGDVFNTIKQLHLEFEQAQTRRHK